MLTGKEHARLRRLKAELFTYEAMLRSSHDTSRDKYINADIAIRKREIEHIKMHAWIRERDEEFERSQTVKWLALCKMDDIDLGESQALWEKLLPEAAEKGWLRNYGSQVDIWLMEIKRKDRAG